jgi:hypothetical protein
MLVRTRKPGGEVVIGSNVIVEILAAFAWAQPLLRT